MLERPPEVRPVAGSDGHGSGPLSQHRSIAPRLVDRFSDLVRGPNWRRVVMLRRGLAGFLVLVALVLAVRPGPGAETAAVLVAVHDLDPGVTLRPADVAVRRWPAAYVPGGALREPAEVDGQVLAGAARAGEPLTDLRLVGPGLAGRGSAEPEIARVPVRLADADVAGLLYPGATVDVVAAGEPAGVPAVLASAAVVLAVLPAEADAARRGRLVLVALPRAVATRVAGASLAQPVTVTLR